MHVSVVCARAVLKKNSFIFPKAQPIVLKPETLTDYRSFSVFVKTACRALDPGQNVIYFTDVDNQQQFLYDIPCLFAAAHEKTEISVLAVTLNTDLSTRLVGWDKVSEAVISGLTPPPDENTKKLQLHLCKHQVWLRNGTKPSKL